MRIVGDDSQRLRRTFDSVADRYQDARPDYPELRDRLNLVLKRRVWYYTSARASSSPTRALFLPTGSTPNRHMTMAYMVRDAYRGALVGVTNIDGSCRPQIIRDDSDGPFAALLREVRARVGLGALLNTSLNIDGEPLVCTAAEALRVFETSGADALAIGPFLVQRAILNVEVRFTRAVCSISVCLPFVPTRRGRGDDERHGCVSFGQSMLRPLNGSVSIRSLHAVRSARSPASRR